ncbi:RNA-binding protein 1-like [Magnolia sinica]|uniref:RNA-binding protein 1-like n=1 Tax=Magnolia sinica TaxID=86752 RepID=UPI00265A28A7|nr:RNA-binding protein 1-like [Magnolia sinica]
MDSYWNRQQPPNILSAALPKRPRSDYDLPLGAPAGHELLNYLPRDEDHSRLHILKDTNSVGASYERYLQNQFSSFGTGGASSNFGGTGLGGGVGGGMLGLSIGEPFRMGGPGAVGPDMVSDGRNMGFGGQVPMDPMVRPGREMPLPPDASSTLFVEGLPPDSTQREVAHIFRPFLGFKEVRLVSKEPKYQGGDRLVLCFVDFTTAGCAATALGALQGYKVDEHDPDSSILRLQYARYPSPRSGPPRSGPPRSGPRSKR